MKFRRRPAPLLLLLLPSLATAISAAAQDNIQSTLSKNTQPRDTRIDPSPSPVVDLTTKSKFDVGTKDAPVDGKDGKPHAGPFVGSEKDTKDSKKDSKKSKSEDGELVVAKEETKMVAPDGTKIPAVNDGVMDDPHRQLPKQGTTGTEGGVSEKDKARKAQEGQTGEKLEKKPDSPKEAPPLPHSEQTKIKNEKSEKSKSKDADSHDDDTAEGLGGLEVRGSIILSQLLANQYRNLMIFPINRITSHILFPTLPTRITLIFRSRIRKAPRNTICQETRAMMASFSLSTPSYYLSP